MIYTIMITELEQYITTPSLLTPFYEYFNGDDVCRILIVGRQKYFAQTAHEFPDQWQPVRFLNSTGKTNTPHAQESSAVELE
jgi:hypothetical protein